MELLNNNSQTQEQDFQELPTFKKNKSKSSENIIYQNRPQTAQQSIHQSQTDDNTIQGQSENDKRIQKRKGIQVFLRLRPDNQTEKSLNMGNCVQISQDCKQIFIDQNPFRFDYVFEEDQSQGNVFARSCLEPVDSFLNGYNVAILVYGQSGSGKTYTILGKGYDNIQNIQQADPNLRGIVPRYMQSIFSHIQMSPLNIEYDVRASYIEIYNEKIKDLLHPDQENIKIYQNQESGLLVSGAVQIPVFELNTVLELIQQGSKVRQMGKTDLNEHSSRSHAIFIITLYIIDRLKGQKKAAQLYLVDLAGSENITKAHLNNNNNDNSQDKLKRIQEAGKINQSLLSLGNVIEGLVQKKKHIAFRDSKLTRLLQNSLGGNSFTTIIICSSKNEYNKQETIYSCQFGQKAIQLQNKPQANVSITFSEVKRLLDEANFKLQEQALQIRKFKQQQNYYQNIIQEIYLNGDPIIRNYLKYKHNFNFDIDENIDSPFYKLGTTLFGLIYTYMDPWIF